MIRGDFDTDDASAARQRGARAGQATWAAGGFLAGIMFWHLVGFWQVVSTAMFDDGRAAAPLKTQALPGQPRPALSSLETGSIKRSQVAGCVALALDRARGTTSAGFCTGGLFDHVQPGIGTKTSREPGSSWLTGAE